MDGSHDARECDSISDFCLRGIRVQRIGNESGELWRERITDEYFAPLGGSVQPLTQDSGWVTLVKGGVSTTASQGVFKETPFGGCGGFVGTNCGATTVSSAVGRRLVGDLSNLDLRNHYSTVVGTADEYVGSE